MGLYLVLYRQSQTGKQKQEEQKMKVKDFPNWRKVVFNDRTLLKNDLRYMSWQ